MTTRDQRPVLVVGAGPSGLTAAVELTRRGVPVRCVDRAEGPSMSTKALGVWPRTLELLRRMGADEQIRRRILPQRAMRYYSDGRVIADLRFRDPSVQPVCLPQPDVETMLRDALTAAGGQVMWGTELVGFQQDGSAVKALLRGPDGVERTEEFSWVVGADGARSRVRGQLDISFEGATHELSFVVADIELDGPLEPDVTHYFCSPRGILVTCGLPSGRFRVFTSAPPGLRRDEVDLAAVQRLVDERGPGGLRLRDPDWISVFSVHSRHAERTREGRAFLLGDAAHIHSPAGGQGLNTGVADAHNLAWKLALCWHGHCDATLLDSFESERGQVARTAIKQAEVQTRIWLLNKPHQVALRDNALRVASALRLFHLDYLPWLAGQRTVYTQPGPRRRRLSLPAGRPWPGSGGFIQGGLVPQRQIWDTTGSRRMPLRAALSDLRHTLLIHGNGAFGAEAARLAAWAVDHCGEVVEVRILDTRAERLRRWAPGRHGAARGPDNARIALVRPDGIADLVCSARDSWRVRRRLEQLFAPLLTSAGTVAPASPAPDSLTEVH
ncbi:FAD-dependent monooxygenase [Streptomyces sp. NPDC052727]|uniref:FAD-dependent monooxygenase n=1 Tax=Streptomyces sp. NPDC052727 TaxID=3154854 RepID=UPI0034207CC5